MMKYYRRFPDIVEKRKRIFFVLFVLLMLLAVAGIFRVRIDPDLMIFMPDRSPSKTSFDEMNRVFESSDEVIIMLDTQSDTLDAEIRRSVVALSDSLSGLPFVTWTAGPVSNGQFAPVSLSGSMPVLKKHEGSWKIFLSLFTRSMPGRKEIRRVEDILKDAGMPYAITGTAYLQKWLMDFIVRILCYLPFVAISLVFLVFRLQMRSMKATLMSVLPAVIGALWTLGLAGWSGREVSIVTAVAPIFTIVIGSADGLHFVSHYLEARKRNESQKTAVGTTLRYVGIPMIITTVTSAAGFLSLLVMDTDAVRELAFFTARGIFAAGLATWFVLPLFLIGRVRLDKAKFRPPRITGKTLKKYFWGWPSVVIAAALLVLSFLAFPAVNTDFNQLSLFKPSTEVRKNADAIAAVQGGSMPVYLYLRHEEDILDEDLRSRIGTVTDSLRDYGRVISPYEAIASMMGRPEFRMMRYFSSERDIIRDILNTEEIPLRHMIDLDANAAKIMLLPASLSSDTLMTIRDIAGSAELPRSRLSVTGISYIIEDLNRRMIDNLRNTLMLSIGIMFVLLLITFRKIVPALISLVPVLITTWCLYGFLGVSGLSLSVITALIFSITVGIGVDYAVHLSSVALEMKDLSKAYAYTARPVMTNALGLAIGMTALVITPLTIHLHISILMWVAMSLSMFLSLSLLPTMLNAYFKRKNGDRDNK